MDLFIIFEWIIIYIYGVGPFAVGKSTYAWMVTHISTMGGDVGLILLKSPYAFSSYMPSFGEKD